jgi:hypothetical protein
MGLGIPQTRNLDQGLWLFSVPHALNQGSICRTTGWMILNSKSQLCTCPGGYLCMYHRWKFSRGLAFDGNFSAEQLKMKCPEDDVHLSDGHGFLVTEAPYKAHLQVAKEIKEVCAI